MCAAHTRVLFLCLPGNGGAPHTSIMKVYQQCWQEGEGWCTQEGVPNSAISAPKLADFLFHLFRVGLAWIMIGIYHSDILGISEPHHLHKASNHPVISKLVCHFFIYSILLLVNILIFGMLNICCLCLRVGHWLLLSLLLNLL